jgi:hypothetical protein
MRLSPLKFQKKNLTSIEHIYVVQYMNDKIHLPKEFVPLLQYSLSTLMPRLPIPKCMDLLSHIGNQCDSDESLMDLAIASIQPRLQPGEVPSACQPLMNGNSDFAVSIMTRLINPKSIPLPDAMDSFPGWFILNKLISLYWTCVASPEQISQLPEASSSKISRISPLPKELQCNFTMSTEDGYEIKVHDWVLYARWSYFLNLFKSGFSEVTEGKLVLPADSFSPKLLSCFVQYLYTQDIGCFDTDNLKLELLRLAPQFNLVDLSTPPVANPHFRKLLKHCREVLNAPCTIESSISQYKVMAEMGSSQQLTASGRFILDHFPTLIRNEEHAKQLKSLGVRAIGEMWLRSRGCEPAEWKQ